MKNKVYIAIGTNQGDRLAYIEDAIKLLGEHPHISLVDYSSIYETEPVGYAEQPKFLNMVLYVYTSMSPSELLSVTQDIENSLGRKRDVRWGPRTIDLDILLYNDENIMSEQLIVPHPRMFERAFVMVPLLELEANLLEQCEIEINDLPDKEGIIVFRQKARLSFTVVEKKV